MTPNRITTLFISEFNSSALKFTLCLVGLLIFLITQVNAQNKIQSNTMPPIVFVDQLEMNASDWESFKAKNVANNGKIEIQIPDNADDIIELQILDEMGSRMFSMDGRCVKFPGLDMDISSYPEGQYTVQIETDNGLHSRKINIIH